MSDYSDKIAYLARQILRDHRQTGSASPSPFRSSNRQTKDAAAHLAALAALFSAAGTPPVRSLAIQTDRPANKYERVEIEALIFYTARQQGLCEDGLRAEIREALSIPSLRDLTALDYQRTRDYLWARHENGAIWNKKA